jgi:copper homeostasis protein (lipoprotein)
MHRTTFKFALVPALPLVLALLLACGAADANSAPPGEIVRRLGPGDSLPQLANPAAYSGVLPCADCAGIETLLILHPDGSFRLRERELRRNGTSTAGVGRWTISSDSLPRLTLHGGPRPGQLVMTGLLTLQALDSAGVPVVSDGKASLVRISAPPTLGVPLRLRGEFRYFADAATLVTCDGGRQFPVAGDSAFVRLQGAYRQHTLGTGAAVLVDAVGQLEPRAGMEEGTQPETFVVQSFEVVERSAACEATRVHALIAIGDWQLRALDGDTLPTLERELQPTLRFVLSEPQLFGNAGCNRFTGRAVLRGLDLIPQPIALTKRMCVDSLAMQRESRYGAVLGDGGWFRLDGTTLVLSKGGVERARFSRR